MWVAFLDSDDEWEQDKLAKQLALAERGRYVAVCSNAYRIDPAQGNLGALVSFDRPELDFSDLIIDNRVITSSVVVKRETLLAVGGFPEEQGLRVGEDYALWLRLAYRQPIGFLDLPLLKYSDTPQTSVRQFSPSGRKQRVRALRDFVKFHQTSNLWRFSRVLLTAIFLLALVETKAIYAGVKRRFAFAFSWMN
jgi:hypothetical protein